MSENGVVGLRVRGRTKWMAALVNGIILLGIASIRAGARPNNPPVIQFGPSVIPMALVPTGLPADAVVEGQTLVTFSVAASDPDGDALTYDWSFGDGTRGHGSTVTHRYARPSIYTATVTVSDRNGGTATDSRTI